MRFDCISQGDHTMCGDHRIAMYNRSLRDFGGDSLHVVCDVDDLVLHLVVIMI